MTIGIVILTLNAAHEIKRCLEHVVSCPFIHKCLVVDSSSNDNTVEIVVGLGVDVHVIPRSDFNHGATREFARKILATDVVVMLTQDCYVTSPEAVGLLVAPLLSGGAEVSYGRQLPRPGANIFEAFPRLFNYPSISENRSIGDVKKLGVYTFFCSDSFSAYKQSSLDAVGGFEHVFTSEDYFAVAQILQSGGRVAYVAEATAYHSHKYTIKEEFKRYFDTGYVRGERPWVQRLTGSAEGRGASMTISLLKNLLSESPWLIPYAIVQTAAKWLGYKIGYMSVHAPVWWKRSLSGQRYHWSSKFYSH